MASLSPSLPLSPCRLLRDLAATAAASWPSSSVIAGVLVFVNYLFINNETLWSALDPVMMLVALLWAVVGLSPDIGGPVGGDGAQSDGHVTKERDD